MNVHVGGNARALHRADGSGLTLRDALRSCAPAENGEQYEPNWFGKMPQDDPWNGGPDP